ncbi:DUF2157 domain-containing protein [Pararhizobium sp.]|uniref:DUF2157 domain-containing protein n=1 Tax=Pararhizobium sp. TaxID=1977563 RepID=UPI00271C65D2|nr:DUF2157 domain-containing protein [Pararhizobium sp.]MDO9415366.1 DUF2157 domain-containing protein [Pararhizobium sp.]
MYRAWIAKDLNLWVSKGLLDGSTAETLLQEYDSRESSFSVGKVLMILAALLVSTAILMLVASNWEAIPRVVRLGTIVGLIWAFYLLAGFCQKRGSTGLAAALMILGTMSFGGAISLVAQMYHLSGDAVDAMLVWFAGACIATVLFRSAALATLAGFLSWAVFWAVLDGSNWTSRTTPYFYALPLLAVIVIALVRYTDAGRARHLAYLSLIGWLGWLYIDIDQPMLAVAFVAGGALCFLASSVKQSPLYPYAMEAGSAPAFYSFAVAILGLVALNVEVDGTRDTIAVAAVTLVAAIGGLSLAGRVNGAVRYLAYTVFAGETLYLCSETIGSIIGTSGFFLISGLFVAFAAWLVIRLEKRFGPTAAAGQEA